MFSIMLIPWLRAWAGDTTIFRHPRRAAGHAKQSEAMVVLLQGGHELEDGKGTAHFKELICGPA
jgi:hypothetical protein